MVGNHRIVVKEKRNGQSSFGAGVIQVVARPAGRASLRGFGATERLRGAERRLISSVLRLSDEWRRRAASSSRISLEMQNSYGEGGVSWGTAACRRECRAPSDDRSSRRLAPRARLGRSSGRSCSQTLLPAQLEPGLRGDVETIRDWREVVGDGAALACHHARPGRSS